MDEQLARDEGERQYTKLRVFVASPGDVTEERNRLEQTVGELNRTVADRLGLVLELLDWRTIAPRMGRPQQVVFDQLPLEKWDVFVGILWARFGTPPGETHPETGEPFLSGTEEEFALAYQAWRETGCPQMLFYRCTRPMPVNVDVVQLQRVQGFLADFYVTGAHPGLFQSYESGDDFASRVRGDLTRLLFDYSEERLLATRSPGLAERIAELQVADLEPPPSPHIPFINREDELKQILSTFAPAYHLLDAPAGYGKTSLLKELQRRFDEQHWLCAYVSVQEHRSLPSIALALAAELGLILAHDGDAQRLGLNLGRAITQQLEDTLGPQEGGKKGVVLLVDVDKRPWASLLPAVDALFTDFIPGVEYALRGSEFFQTRHSPFRVIFAGRYLAGKTPQPAPFPLTVLKLTPFNYEVVRDTAEAYLSDQRAIGQLAAHLMHCTAGHPGCMARVLEMYEETRYPPDEFFSYSAEEIYEGTVCPEASAVRSDVPRELRGLFDALSIFRCVDYGVLRKVLDWTNSPLARQSEFDIADRLTSTYLMDWSGRLLRDAITRRLLVIRWLREVPPPVFVAHCQHAMDICKVHLEEPQTQMPEIWALEFLFQSLQRHADHVQDERHRGQMRQTFFEETVSLALGLLVRDREIQAEKNVLRQAMDNDWELRFTVNYFLRQNEYGDTPWRELRERVENVLT